jgi:DNA helicase-2/ATP-dependent DNA helicase PcrA
MDSKIKPIDQIIEIIDNNQNPEKEFKNFVLQGGAGSGKTESLKQILEYISDNHPDKKVVCITLTNIAVDEIKSRIRDNKNFLVSTIHAFLNDLIKDYKKNIHQVIFEIFKVNQIIREELIEGQEKKEYDTNQHENFKKIYKKFSSMLFTVKGEKTTKVIGIKDYDKEPVKYNEELNKKINILNVEINEIIISKDYKAIKYNETRYDNFEDLSFGHDKLLEIANILFGKYDLLGKIISDKFDFIFIDEYQDTNQNIVDIFLDKIPLNKKTTIGLFGDSMQGIYDDGIGDVQDEIDNRKLFKIDKEDNYRCSDKVIEFINGIRSDDLKQEIALKEGETLADRRGKVKLYYSFYNNKPNAFSNKDEKEKYFETLNELISKVSLQETSAKRLMLTNKSISSELDFSILYQIFNDRYSEVKEEIEKTLARIQLIELYELCNAYKNKNYNFVLTHLKKCGFELKSIEDKIKIKDIFEKLLSSTESVSRILNFAFENNLLRRSDSYKQYISNKDSFLETFKRDEQFLKLEVLFNDGNNTAVRIAKADETISEEEFEEFDKNLKKKMFYTDLFSEKLKFSEVINYYNYIDENIESSYITMHKTKGSGIENVMVVMDEYFWNKYNFKSVFDIAEVDLKRKLKNQKLFYVACSRTIRDLTCVRLVSEESEEKQLLEFFKEFEFEKVIL